jgi:phosphopantetheine--protein transferase-like protein
VQILENTLHLLLFDLGAQQNKIQSIRLLPALLAEWSGLEESVFRLEKDHKKKPFFVENALKGVSVSISHTANWLSCAIYAEQHIGVDIERTDRKANLKLAERYFAQDEVAYLFSNAASEYCFIRLWTLKESFGKAMGVGINQVVLATSFLTLLLQKQDSGYLNTTTEQSYWMQYEELLEERLILSYCSSKHPTKVVLEKL